LIVGVVVGFAVVAGVGFAVATGGDGDEGSAQAAAADQVAAAAKAEPPPPVAAPEPEPAPTAAEAEPAPSEVDEPAPTEDPAQPETAEEAPEAAPEPEPEAEPEPESEPEPEPAPMPAPVEDESEYGKLVGEAVAALQANDHRRAYDVASRANDLEARNPSLEVMARAACHLGQNPDARKAYRGIVGATIRRRVNDECTGLGVKLQFKGDGWMPIELLALAEKALERGEYQQAFDYAQESHKGKRRSVAMSLMGQAQCGLKNGEEAQRYHDLVRPVDRPPIIDACKKHGVPIKEPEG
jgi:outer membrane biosynthesis protein TonB